MLQDPAIRPDGATEVRETYKQLMREAQKYREVPRVPIYTDDLPKEQREWAREGVAASEELTRSAQSRTFSVSFSLREMEERRREREARLQAQLDDLEHTLREGINQW